MRRTVPKSALRVAREALAVGRAALPVHGSRCSRHDDTQPRLLARLVLKRFLKTGPRGVVTLVAERREVRRTLGLRTVPHCPTLAHAAQRPLAGAERGGPSAMPRRRLSSMHGMPAGSMPHPWPPRTVRGMPRTGSRPGMSAPVSACAVGARGTAKGFGPSSPPWSTPIRTVGSGALWAPT